MADTCQHISEEAWSLQHDWIEGLGQLFLHLAFSLKLEWGCTHARRSTLQECLGQQYVGKWNFIKMLRLPVPSLNPES